MFSYVCCLQRFETIHLHLPLGNPATEVRTAELEKLGFFFAEIMPGCKNNDELILQYLNNYVIDYDALSIESDMGREMFDYVKKHDQHEQTSQASSVKTSVIVTKMEEIL
ncbi:MAG: hypothetical protein GY694_11705 [Gammaproteobacteria bacterium]|nr:hypothetical protein [Gammaproteobacteria bacterium]